MRSRLHEALLCMALVAVVWLTAACREGGNGKQASTAVADSMMTAVPDTTLYGTCGESGMSSFTLLTAGGDTLQLTRVSEDGEYGEIMGDVDEGARFAVTKRADEDALVRAINLTQLEDFTRQYIIWNCNLILRGNERADTVQIVWLDADSLVVVHSSGRRQAFLPQ